MHPYCSLDLDPAAHRFWQKVDDGEHWLWTAATTRGGYGWCVYQDRNMHAHRAAWLMTGQPIPEGLRVLHTCDIPPCVRNDEHGWYEVNGVTRPRRGHLWVGTQADNMADQRAKGRGALVWASRPDRRRDILDYDQVCTIRWRYWNRKATQEELAAEYGVLPLTIHNVVQGKSHRSVPFPWERGCTWLPPWYYESCAKRAAQEAQHVD